MLLYWKNRTGTFTLTYSEFLKKWSIQSSFSNSYHGSINYIKLRPSCPSAYVAVHCLYLCPQRDCAPLQPLIWALCHCVGLQQHTMRALFSAEVPQLGLLGMLSAQLSLSLIVRNWAVMYQRCRRCSHLACLINFFPLLHLCLFDFFFF